MSFEGFPDFPTYAPQPVQFDGASTGTIAANAWEHRLRTEFGGARFDEIPSDNSLVLPGFSATGVADVLCLCARALSANPTARGAITWRELQ